MIIAEGSQYYGIVFYQFGRPYSAIENALYACLHRVLFALGGNFLLLCYMTTGFGEYLFFLYLRCPRASKVEFEPRGPANL